MAKAKIRVAFDEGTTKAVVTEEDVEFDCLREPGGKEYVSKHLFSKARVAARWGSYYMALPDVAQFARGISQSFRPDDFISGEYENRINTRHMWIELSHVLLRVKVLLAQSKAYHEEELSESERSGPEAENIKWHLHLDKMERFDLAVILLGKVNELTARLVFERLGTSLIPNLDTTRLDWERRITWTAVRKALNNRTTNPHLAAIPITEYDAICKIFDDFLRAEHGQRIWDYRVRLVHRVSPSVDYPGFYTQLEDRKKEPILDEKGQVKGWRKSIGAFPTTADYSFADLYRDATETFTCNFSLLERLRTIARFGPEADASAT